MVSFRRHRKKLGLAFHDSLQKVSSKISTGKQKETEWEDSLIPNLINEREVPLISVWRIVLIGIAFILISFSLFLRMFYLQIVTGEANRALADSNRIQIRIIHAPRGVIYDRNGQILADNEPGFRLKNKFISRDEALSLEASHDPRANELEIDTIRHYPYGEIAAHVVGYVGQISSGELKEPQYANYRSGDRIGRAGVEQVYENVLRGKDGAEIIEVDADGRKIQTLRTINPIPGDNIYLSLDINLQKELYSSVKEAALSVGSCCGAAIVQNPQNGDVLAMVSYPSFDPNAFTDPHKDNLITSYFNDPNAPLLNRAISGTYPPGSTFKITSALAGLSSGKITPQTIVNDTGILHLGKFTFTNWYYTQYGKVEGPVDMVKALQRSNDTYFYVLGEKIGEKILGDTALKIGFGQRLGIDLPGEATGLVPDNRWKEKNIGQIWYPGDTLHMAIGQGYLLTTPLQIIYEINLIADNGQDYRPHLVTKITASDGSLIKKFTFFPVDFKFDPSFITLVKKGISLVPQYGGTAWPFFNFSIPTAGKTGTAEYGDPKGRTHAWYVSYAPINNPQLSSVVLIEGGGEGSNVAAPVVKNIYTWYFSPDKTKLKNFDAAPVSTSAAKLGE